VSGERLSGEHMWGEHLSSEHMSWNPFLTVGWFSCKNYI